MSINNDKKKLTDIFKTNFEPGSDGSESGNEPKQKISTVAASSDDFQGTLKFEGDKPVLVTLGGGKFRLNLKSGKTLPKKSAGGRVSVSGIQSGDVINNAVVNFRSGGEIKLTSAVSKNPELKKLSEAVKKFIPACKKKNGFITARPGYRFVDGIITNEPAIVAVVDRKIHAASLNAKDKLPDTFEGYNVQVVSASPSDLLISKYPEESAAISSLGNYLEPTFLESMADEERKESSELEAAKLGNGYVRPDDVSLDEITGPMTILCHVSPEGGWKSLCPFIEDTNEHLQVAMYDFSAPGISDSLNQIVKNGASLTLVYDGNPAANVGSGTKSEDLTEDAIIRSLVKSGKKNFKYIKAWKGKDGICNNAYHIKVAVKDMKSFWLSSGNWQSSNQPDKDFSTNAGLTAKYNREWNAIIENNKLSEIYYKFIDWDFVRSSEKPEDELIEKTELPDMYAPEEEPEAGKLAKYLLFPPKKFVYTNTKPLKVQPVLTPDNYIEHALEIIKSAENTLYFQNQYIKINADLTPEYEELLTALRDKINEVDGRIILRSLIAADDRKMMESLKAFGFDMARVKLMKNTHTKGIIADGKRIMLGSHNWSNAGVQYNRDASLLIYDDKVAQYYLDVFLHDWERRTITKIKEETVQIGEGITEASIIEDGLAKVDWREYFS